MGKSEGGLGDYKRVKPEVGDVRRGMPRLPSTQTGFRRRYVTQRLGAADTVGFGPRLPAGSPAGTPGTGLLL